MDAEAIRLVSVIRDFAAGYRAVIAQARVLDSRYKALFTIINANPDEKANDGRDVYQVSGTEVMRFLDAVIAKTNRDAIDDEMMTLIERMCVRPLEIK